MARKDQEKHENDNMKEHLLKSKCKLTVTESKLTDAESKLTGAESKLTDTSNQLAKVTKDVSTLEVLLYLAMNKPDAIASYRPTCSAVVLDSSLKWSDKLVAMVMMSKSGDQECPVILNMIEYNKQNKGKMMISGTVIPFTLTTRDTRSVCEFILMVMVMVKALTCQCSCTS